MPFHWQILLKNPSARHKQGCKKLQSSMYRPMRCKFQEDRKKEKEQWSHNKMLWFTDCDVRVTRIDLALGDNVLTLLPWLMKVKKYSFLPYKYSTQINTPCQFKFKPNSRKLWGSTPWLKKPSRFWWLGYSLYQSQINTKMFFEFVSVLCNLFSYGYLKIKKEVKEATKAFSLLWYFLPTSFHPNYQKY